MDGAGNHFSAYYARWLLIVTYLDTLKEIYVRHNQACVVFTLKELYDIILNTARVCMWRFDASKACVCAYSEGINTILY